MAKNRKTIPKKVASQVLIANRHACCLCQNTLVQIHHIDEDPSNNHPSNLAILCHEHHDQASMQLGLSKKLGSDEIREYKRQWEAKCAADIQALSRDRLTFYATLYKNPPRIRQFFSALPRETRLQAVDQLQSQIREDIDRQNEDSGFQWQAVPGDNPLTGPLLSCLRSGELWPSVLHRVQGHKDDPDYPVDMSPPHGMTTFHGFDLYCQLLVRTLCIASPPTPLENLWQLGEPDLIDQFAGSLVTFRELAIGKNLSFPAGTGSGDLGRVQFRVQRKGVVYRAIMPIKNMYIFSSTSALDLERSRVCGVAMLTDAQTRNEGGRDELQISLKPLLIGTGGFGQSVNGFWLANSGTKGSESL